jgi:enoyl-CoA hydratase/carnithine racemase
MTTVKYDVDGAVGIVSLAKPPHNLLDDAMINDLLAAYRRAVHEGCRAILLRSEMRHFCAGAEMRSFTNGETKIQHDAGHFAEFLDVLENAPVPTVAAVHGGALGGGLEVALTCDMIIAADTAYLGQVENIVGLIPLLGGTQRLVQRAGVARAKEIAMIGRRYSPEAFERWGIINHVVPEAELPAAALSLARQLAAGPTAVLNGIKRQANLAASGGIQAADAVQIEINDTIWKTADRERGFAAFFATGPGTAAYEGD